MTSENEKIPQAVFCNDQIIVTQSKDLRKRTFERYPNQGGSQIDPFVKNQTRLSNQVLLRQNSDLEMLKDKKNLPHEFGLMEICPNEEPEIGIAYQDSSYRNREDLLHPSFTVGSTVRNSNVSSLLKQQKQADLNPSMQHYQELNPTTPIGPMAYISKFNQSKMMTVQTNLIQNGDSATNYGLARNQQVTPLVQKLKETEMQ